MSASVAKLDLESLKEFQNELHLAENEDEEITSNFYREFRKTTWYTHMPVRLKATANENQIVYSVNNTFHWLRYVYMRQHFPALRVKKEFEGRIMICWPHNLGHNVVVNTQLKFDDDIPQSFDTYWYDIYSQFYMKPGFREHYNVCIGNIPALEKWSNFICEYTTNTPQPFYFMRDESLAIPLLFCSLSTIEFHYRVHNKIENLLRMRVRKEKQIHEEIEIKNEDGSIKKERVAKKVYQWMDIDCNLKYLEGAGSGLLKTPELWGRYAYITDEECKWWKECIQNEKGEHVYYIEDITSADSPNTNPYGKNATVELNGKNPAKAIFWVAENMKARNHRNYSNYTTNIDNLYDGWNPIRSISLTYNGNPRLDNMDSDHFDKMEPYFHFPSPPSEAGYNAYSFSNDSTSLDAEIGRVFDGIKATFSALLGNTDPFLKPVKKTGDRQAEIEELDDDKMLTDTSNGEFILRVRMLVMKKLTFKLDQDKKRFLITV